MMTRTFYQIAMLRARAVADRVRALPLADLRSAIEHAEAFDSMTDELRGDRVLIDALTKASDALRHPEPHPPYSVEQADAESGDASRVLFATGAP